MIDFQNASFVKLSKANNSVASDVESLYLNDEQTICCYKGIRDYIVFTNKRIITVNVQGITGKKKDFTSLPYSKIQTFSIETAGVLDLDSELEIWFSGLGKVKLEFSGKSDIITIGKTIGQYML